MASFRLNPGLERQLKRSPEMLALRRRKAAEAAAEAKRLAPVSDDKTPGEFRDSIHADGTRFGSSHPKARFIIHGTSDTPPHDTLQRAAESVGLHLRAR